jgi:hypothetical protein
LAHWVVHPKIGRAEALRRSMLAMITACWRGRSKPIAFNARSSRISRLFTLAAISALVDRLPIQPPSLDALAHIDLGLIIRVPEQAHVVATECGNPKQPTPASFGEKPFRGHRREMYVRDACGLVV